MYFQNLNGISYFNEYIEFDMLLEYINEIQVDIAGFTEINLDLMNANVRNNLQKKREKIGQTPKNDIFILQI